MDMIHDIKDVLIYSAMTNLEYEQQKKGFGRLEHIQDLKKVQIEHDEHYRGLEMIVDAYEKLGISPLVREREDLSAEDLKKEWHIVQPYGGDRTFLKIASLITNGTLLMGIKAKKTSYGAHYNTNLNLAQEHIERLIAKDFEIEERARIMARWPGFAGELAANDVFIGKKYTMSYTRAHASENENDTVLGSNGVLISTYRGGPGWYNNILTKSQDPKETAIAKKALADAGLPSDLIDITEHRATFRPGDEGLLRYKSINTKESSAKGYGLILKGEKLNIEVKVPGCVVSFDGIEPGVEWPRCFEIDSGKIVEIMLSEKPLYVVNFS